MHQEFSAVLSTAYVDYTVDVVPITDCVGDILMTVMAEQGPIYITKAQAMAFFNLVPKE